MADTFGGSQFTAQQIQDWGKTFNGDSAAAQQAAINMGYGDLYNQAVGAGLLSAATTPATTTSATTPATTTSATTPATTYTIGTAGNATADDVKNWWAGGAGGKRTVDEVAAIADQYDMTPEQIASALGLAGYAGDAQGVVDYVNNNMSNQYGWTAANGGLDPYQKKKRQQELVNSPALYNPTTRSIDASQETIEGRLNNLLDPENATMKRAMTGALQQSNARGLLNSSISSEAGMAAMIDKGIQIAGPDAQTYFEQGKLNQGYQNDASKFNAGEANNWNLTQQKLAQERYMFDADIAFKGQLARDQLEQQLEIANIDDATKNRIADLDAQVRRDTASASLSASMTSSANSLESARLSYDSSKRNNAMQLIYSAMANPDFAGTDANGQPIINGVVQNILNLAGLDFFVS